MTEVSTADLYAAWRRCVQYVEIVAQRGAMVGRDDVSDFWREYLDARPRYASFNEALVLRRGSTWPLAERGSADLETERERSWAESAWFVTSREVPRGFLDRLNESPIGAPITFEFDGRPYSAGFLTNALTTWRVADWIDRRGLADRPLRVLEIGAGYGHVAYQLAQLVPIELYVVCDLPENLFLSAYYLQATLPGRDVVFIDPDTAAPEEGLAFTIPPLVEQLDGQFDVVLNTYSFQEMNLESVHAYFRLAERILAKDGFLYSLNSHGKSGVARPLDYPFEAFRLLGFAGVRRFPYQAFATAPYELVLGRRGPNEHVPTELARTAIDVLGRALQLGLHAELAPLAERLVEGRLSPADEAWLEAASRLFDAVDVSAKQGAAAELARAEAATEAAAFLAGALAFATGDANRARATLSQFAEGGGSSYALALASLMVSSLCKRRGERSQAAEWLDRASSLVPYLAQPFRELARHPRRLAAHVGTLLGVPNEELPRRLPRPAAEIATLARRRLRSET